MNDIRNLGYYESTLTAAARWGVTARRVRKLCATGRIPGVLHVGRDWLLPAGSEQPSDRRRRSAVQQHNAGGNPQEEQETQAGEGIGQKKQLEEVD